MNIAYGLVFIAAVLLLFSVILLVARRQVFRPKGLIPEAPQNICRCCCEPEALFPGGVCRACLSVRTVGDISNDAILHDYEGEMSQQ